MPDLQTLEKIPLNGFIILAAAIIFGAFTLRGKFTVTGSRLAIIVAWILLVIGFVQLANNFHNRTKWLVISISVSSVLSFWLLWWMKGPVIASENAMPQNNIKTGNVRVGDFRSGDVRTGDIHVHLSLTAEDIARKVWEMKPIEVGKVQESSLEPVFYGRKSLHVRFHNNSPCSAEKIKYWFGLLDLNNPYYFPEDPFTAQPLPIPTKVLDKDFIRPGDSMAVEVLTDACKVHVKPGDIIYGFVVITCVNCRTNNAAYVYWKIGVGGWYAKADPNKLELPLVQPPTAILDSQIEEYVNRVVPKEGRVLLQEA
jgi:hypothetical protein